MKSLQDDLYNWLTIKVVADARPEDTAANETEEFFFSMLKEDHHVEEVSVDKEEGMYYVTYKVAGETKKTRFPVELIDIMHNQIESNPEKYQNYPSEDK